MPIVDSIENKSEFKKEVHDKLTSLADASINDDKKAMSAKLFGEDESEELE